MDDIQQPEIWLGELLTRLGFEPGDQDHAFGEIEGSPVSMTLLGVDPLALLFAFKIVSPHPERIHLPAAIASRVASENADVSLEGGIAWLSLDDLTDETVDSTQSLLASFGRSLAEAGLIFPPGCVCCGGQDDARLLFAEGRCSRLCPRCADSLFQGRERAEQQLNRTSGWRLFGVPLLLLYVGAIWSLAWLMLDALLRHWNTDTIVIQNDELTSLILMALLGAIGFGAGYPLGAFLRRCGGVRWAPRILSVLAVLLACAVGEAIYISVCVWQQAGTLDLALSLQLFIPWVRQYQASWLVVKIVVAGAIAVGCCVAVSLRRRAPVPL